MAWLFGIKGILTLVGVVGIVALGWYAYASIKESGRDEIRQEVAAVIAGQQNAAKDETVRQMGKIHANQIKRLKIVNEAISKISNECAVDDEFLRTWDRLRETEGADNGADSR
jgi:hypothetical protein